MTRNPDQLKAEELHAQAWEIVQPDFERSQQETIARCQELASTEKTATV
ncbi:hypothetical protein [Chroococcidiopsis sp [FACHB-1243]]